jgi:long-chain acyl-CoA synthetase
MTSISHTASQVTSQTGSTFPTLSSLMQFAIQRFPNHIAMQLEESAVLTSYTYAELDTAAKAAAEQLKTLGVQPGMRVVLLCENRPEWVITFFALLNCQATVVILDTALEVSDYIALIEDAIPVAAIVSERLQEKLSDIKSIPILTLKNYSPLNTITHIHAKLDAESDPAIAVILYTSGTTGKFKGVLLTHENLLYTIQIARELVQLNEQDSALCLLPAYHVFGLVCALLTPLTVGAKVSFVEKLQSDVILHVMQMSGCTILPAVPRLLDLFAAGIERQVAAKPLLTRIIFRTLYTVSGLLRSWFDYNLGQKVFKPVHASFGGKVRLIISGGAALDKNVFYQLEALGFTVLEGYGLTEAASLVSANIPTQRRMGSVGLPAPGTQVTLFNTNAMGEGEIVVQGPHIMRGYFRDPEATKMAIQDDGFHTGDLGKFDAEGNLIITGRIKELIVKPNGEKAMPEDIERRYRQIPGVAELAVVGMPAKEGYGEEIHAAIVLAGEEQGTLFEQAVKNQIIERSLHVPSALRIQECHFVTAFPKTSTLKVKRKRLVQQLLTAAPKQENEIPVIKVAQVADDALIAVIIKAVHEVILQVVSPTMQSRLSHIKPEFSLQFDLGLDSLSRMELAQAIQQRFSIRFEEQQLAVLYTVNDLIQAVKKTQQARTTLPSNDETALVGSILSAERLPTSGASKVVYRSVISRFLQKILFSGIKKFMAFYFRVETKGKENLPTNAPFIIAANHTSHLDGMCVAIASDLPIDSLVFMAAKDYHFGSLIASVINIAPFERNLEMVGLLHNIQDSRYYVDQGKNLVIFPEGTRSINGQMQQFKSAVAMIAAELGIQIVPAYISGAYDCMPKGTKIPRRGKITVTFGKPLVPAQSEQSEQSKRGGSNLHDYQAYKAISMELRRRIEALQ